MQKLLDGLLPRLFPGLPFLCVPHEGKSDLERSIPRKLRAWREPGVRFAVVRDNDGGDCRARKDALRGLCEAASRPDTLVRLACQALEAWYLGEPDAIAEAFGRQSVRNPGRRARFRDPDAVARPHEVLERHVPEFQKVSGARRLAQHLTRERNRSTSFRIFLVGIEAVAGALATGQDEDDRWGDHGRKRRNEGAWR